MSAALNRDLVFLLSSFLLVSCPCPVMKSVIIFMFSHSNELSFLVSLHLFLFLLETFINVRSLTW